MSIIATLLPQSVHVQRLRTAIRDRHEVRECEDWLALSRTCEREPVRMAIVDLFGPAEPNFESIRQLKQRLPRLAILAYVTMSLDRGHALFDAGRAGVDGLVLSGEDDAPRALLAQLERAEARSLAGSVRRSLDGIDALVVDAVLLAITRAHERLTPSALARLLAQPPRAVAHRLAAEGFPTPQRLLTWGRLISAAHLLEDEHRSADRVAAVLEFPSGSAFRNICQRYLHATPGEIRERGGASYVVRAMLRQVRHRMSSRQAPRRSSATRMPTVAI